MRRFVIDQIPSEDDKVTICGSEARHIARVLRMKPTDHLILMDTQGKRYEAIIVSACPTSVELKLLNPVANPENPLLHMTLCQAALKAKAMDLVIQKATELGVTRIIPFSSERSVIRLQGNRMENKLRHWREIARNATAQSDRTRPPEILPMVSFDKVLEMGTEPEALGIILWEQERSADLKSILREQGSKKKKIIGVVGPEGGFSTHEIELATKAGFVPVTLGKRILRAETAAMVLCTLCLYECGDLGLPESDAA